MKQIQRQFFPILLLLASVTLVVLWLWPAGGLQMPSSISWGILLAVTAWISWFCLDLDSTEVDITHILAFTYGLVAEPLWSIIASGAGFAAARLLRQVGRSSGRTRTRNSRSPAPPYTLHLSRSIFGVTLGFVIYRLAGGEQLTISQPVPGAIPFLAAAISYSLVVFGLVFLERRIYRLTNLNPRLTILLGMLIVFPMPVAMMGAIAYAILGAPALMIYGIFVGVAAPFIRQVIQSMKLDEALVDRLVELEGLERFAESLAVSLTSQDLYAVILDQALHATKADAGQLALFSEPEHELVPVAVEPPMGRDELIVSPGTEPELIGHVAASAQPVRIDNSELPQARKFHLKSETQALLGVPILDPAGNLGALILEKYTRDPFTDTDQSVLVRIASQAAGAIRNARLYQELEQRLTEQSLLYQASAQIAETLETEAVALATADGLAISLSAYRVSVYQLQVDDGQLKCLASVVEGRPILNSSLKDYDPETLPFMHTCLAERKIQNWTLDTAPSKDDKNYLEAENAQSILVVPLAIGQRTLGLLEITSLEPDHFTAESERIAQSIAIQAAIALENTGLFQSTIEGHDRLMAIMNSTREGVVMIDLTGRMLMVNKLAGEFLGIDHHALENRLITEPALRLEQRLGYKQGEMQNLVSALDRGASYYSSTNTFLSSSADSHFLQRNDSPVFDSDGNLIGWLIVLRDVTQQRELEESRKQLTEMIVHDLRGPLTAILSGLTLLKTHLDEGSESPIVDQAITVSERSVHQMLGLVNSLLTISNLESGTARLNLESVDLTAMMEEIAEIYLPEANKSGIIIELDLQSVSKVTLDREKIARVLSNLIDNALKFTPTGGQIKMRLLQDEQQVDIQILDTGPGIPMEYRERIFDRYGQIPGISGRRRGTGLGLAFSKLAVDAHHGRIWVEDNPTGGSIFRIQLPNAGPAVADDS